MPQWRALGHLAQNLQASLRYLCSSSVNANSHPKTLLAAICSPAQSRLTPYASAIADSSRALVSCFSNLLFKTSGAIALFLILFLCNFNANATPLNPATYTAVPTTGDVYIAGSAAGGFKLAVTVDVVTNVPTLTISKVATYTPNALRAATFENAYKDAYGISRTTVLAADAYNLPFKVVLPTTDDISQIATDCFNGKTGLISIISEGATTLNKNASVTVPKTDNAFAGCVNLEEVDLPAITIAPVAHFTGCTKIKTLKLGISTGFDEYLAAMPNLEVVEFEGLTTLEENAFKGKSKLTSITVGSSIAAIPAGAFQGCTALKTLSALSSVTEIGANAFNGCSSLTSLTAGTLTALGASAFKGCAALTGTVNVSSVTDIPESAFEGCAALTGVTLNSSSWTVAKNAFKGCVALSGLSLAQLSNTEIPEGAFEGSGITTLTNLTSITSIGKRAFANSKLSAITLTGFAGTIGEEAFAGCTSATNAASFGVATSLGAGALQGCTGITGVTICSTIVSIPANAFKGCTTLATCTLEAAVSNPAVIALSNANAFEGVADNAVIFGPTDIIAQYRTAANWSTFNNPLKAPLLVSTASASSCGVSFKVPDGNDGVSVAGASGAAYTSGTAANAGVKVTLTAANDAAKCFEFSHWEASTQPGVSVGEELTLDVYAYDIVDLEYLAVGKAKQIPAAIAGGGGTVEGSKNAVMLPCGTEITVTAVADEGYQFAGWKKVTSDAVTEQAGDEALKITPVIGEQYMALFKIIPHFGNITVKNGGKVSVGQPAP